MRETFTDRLVLVINEDNEVISERITGKENESS